MMPIRPTASGCKQLKNDGQRAPLPIEPAPTIRVDHWCRGRSVFGALRDTRFVSVVTNRRDSNTRLGAQARLSQPPIFRGANHLLLCGSYHHSAVAPPLVEATRRR